MDNFILKFPPNTELTNDELFEFCSANRDLQIERNNKGQLTIMSPSGGLTGYIHFKIYMALTHWYEKNKETGYVFDASVGFRLPDGSVLAPDAAFVSKNRWKELSKEDQEKFPPITPDFIIEVRSKSDSLSQLQSKMMNWLNNGCLLAWLIDPIEEKAYVYRKAGLIKTINSFDKRLSGEEVLPDFGLELNKLK